MINAVSFLIGLSLLLFVSAKRDVLVWMGLERTHEDIPKVLRLIDKHREVITQVSFEKYDLGWNSTLVLNNFTDVLHDIQRLGLATYPLITTVNSLKIAQLVKDPKPFIEECVNLAVKYNYTGYDIDFEPKNVTTPGEL